MSRVVVIALSVTLVALQYRLWVADSGYAEVQRLQDRIASVRVHNKELARRNAALEAEIKDLKGGDAAMAGRARSDLGMIRKGEDFYLIVQRQ